MEKDSEFEQLKMKGRRYSVPALTVNTKKPQYQNLNEGPGIRLLTSLDDFWAIKFYFRNVHLLL